MTGAPGSHAAALKNWTIPADDPIEGLTTCCSVPIAQLNTVFMNSCHSSRPRGILSRSDMKAGGSKRVSTAI